MSVSVSDAAPGAPAVLRSDRLALRAPDEHDIDTIAALCQDPDVQRWTTVPSPYTRDDAVGFVRNVVAAGWTHGTTCTWSIRLDGAGVDEADGADGPEGSLVGMIGLDGIRDAGAELGYWLSPDARGNGMMSEAVRLVLDFGFGVLGLRRIAWHAFTGNLPSASVARRAGFRFEGMARLEGVQRGTRHDSWQAGLLADDPRTPTDGWPEETLAPRDSAGR